MPLHGSTGLPALRGENGKLKNKQKKELESKLVQFNSKHRLLKELPLKEKKKVQLHRSPNPLIANRFLHRWKWYSFLFDVHFIIIIFDSNFILFSLFYFETFIFRFRIRRSDSFCCRTGRGRPV